MAPKISLLGSNGQYSRLPLTAFAAEMRRLGISKLDFVPQTPHLFCSHAGVGNILNVVRELAGLQVEFVTPPPYRYSITAPEGRQWEATFAYYVSALKLAKTLGGRGVVVGAAGACWDTEPRRLEDRAAHTLKLLCAVAERLDLMVLLAPAMGEDTPLIAESPVLGTAKELVRMLNRVSSPRLWVVLDTNVLSSRGETIQQWFEVLGGHTALVRLCDGNYHGWRAWGEGCLPVERYLAQLQSAGYAGPYSLYLPGERYIQCPAHPDELALAALRGRGVEE